MKLIYTKSTLAMLCLASTLCTQAQVTDTGTYTQNFNAMTGTTAPTGWSVVSESGSHFTFAPPNSYNYAAEGSVSPNFTAGTLSTQTITVDPTTPAVKGASGYNWTNNLATAGNGEGAHSLGTSPSGNAATILELNLTNNTGSAVGALSIAYDIDRYTTTSDNTGVVTSGSANYGVEEYPGYQLFYNLTPTNATTWVNVASLNPTIDAGTGGAVSVPNSVGITVVSPTTVSLASAWTSGSTLGLAWFDDNAESPSPDQELGLNNVSVIVAPEPSSIALFALGGAALLFFAARRRQQA